MKNTTTYLSGMVLSYDVDHTNNRVTVAIAGGADENPVIVAFDREDLDQLSAARKELKRGPSEPDPGLVLSILNAAGLSSSFVYDRVEYRLFKGEWVAYRRVDIEDVDRPPALDFFHPKADDTFRIDDI